MTDRERAFVELGVEYAEGIERASSFGVPGTGRVVRQVLPGVWAAQPWDGNGWKEFSDPLEALRFATPPAKQ
jgi:hypothetical protein